MAAKVLLLCAHVILIQSISGLYYDGPLDRFPASPWITYPYAAARFPGPYVNNPAALSASNGGGLVVSSSSPVAPVGVTVESQNVIEGILAVIGELPFLGSVALEGALPTAGAGDIAYGCGNGEVAMLAEDEAPQIFNAPYGYRYGIIY